MEIRCYGCNVVITVKDNRIVDKARHLVYHGKCRRAAIEKYEESRPGRVKPVEPAPEYVPIDAWAEEQHPKFLADIQTTVQMMTPLNEEERYSLVRMVMTFARQEFDGGPPPQHGTAPRSPEDLDGLAGEIAKA